MSSSINPLGGPERARDPPTKAEDPRNLISFMRAEGSGHHVDPCPCLTHAPDGRGEKTVDTPASKARFASVEESGLEFEVGALGTTVQGPSERLWPLMRELHDACFTAGADTVMTHIRILEAKDDVI